jgi:hypothetical protein
VDQRLDALSAQGRYVVSDRAKALIPLAEQGLECLSMPDFFPLMHDIVKSYSLALGQRLKQARQELQKAEDRLRRSHEGNTRGEAYREATPQVEGQPAQVRHWETRHQEYRQQLATRSLTLHPFAIDDSAPQTSAQVEARLHTHVEAIAAVAHAAQLPERPAAMTKVKKPWPAVAALGDGWWQGVRQDVEPAAVSPPWQRWAPEVLLPRR